MAYANGYTYRKKITVDATKVSGAGSLTDFPVLVSHTDVALKTVANSGKVENASGYDIRFETAAGMELDYERLLYVATTGQIIAWVQATVDGTTSTEIYLYYGNSSVSTDQSDPTGTWDANFKAVYHMVEDPSTPAVSYVDSTTAEATGTAASVTKPTGLATGDVVICILHTNGPKTTVDNNGSAPFSEKLVDRSYNGPSAQVDIYYRVIDGTEGSTFDFTLSASDRWCLQAIAFRGVDTANIWDVAPSATTENTGTGSTNTTDALTTIHNGAMIVALAVNDSNTVTFSGTPADGFTTAENDSGTQLLSTAYKSMAIAGAQSAVSWTQSGSNGTWLNNIFSLRPIPKILDSTSNNYDLTTAYITAAWASGDSVTGKVYKGLDFNGNTDGRYLLNASWGILTENAARTMEILFKFSNEDNQHFISWGAAGGNNLSALGLYGGGIGFLGYGNDNLIDVSDNSYANGAWHHCAITHDGTTMKVIIDGVEKFSGAESLGTDSGNLNLGRFVAGGDNAIAVLEEARIHDSARSNDWVITTWNTINDPSTFYALGSEETSTATYTVTTTAKARVKKAALTVTTTTKARIKGLGVTTTVTARARIRGATPMRTLVMGLDTNGRTAATNVYHSLCSSGTVTTSLTNQVRSTMPVAGSVKRFLVKCVAGPGAGITRSFMLQKNDVDTGLVVALTGVGTGLGVSWAEVSGDITFAPGDKMSIRNYASATTTDSGSTRFAFEIEAPGNTSMLLTGTVSNLVNGSDNWMPVQGRGSGQNIASEHTSIFPTSGRIMNVYASLSGSPGTGKAYTFRLYKNGVGTDITFTISGSNTSGSDLTHFVDVAAGDTLFWYISVDSGANNQSVSLGAEFSPDISGESVQMYSSPLNTTNSAVRYNALNSNNAATWQSSELNRMFAAVESIFKKLYVQHDTVPGSGKSYLYQLNKSGSAGNPSVTISDSETGDNDTSNVIAVNDFDTVVMKVTPSGTPAVSMIRYSFVSFIGTVVEATKTLTAKARIKKSGITSTVTAKARVKTAGTLKTVTAKARVKHAAITATISAKASVVSALSTKTVTVTAKARIKKASILSTVTAKARIKTAGTVQTIATKSRIKNTVSKTVVALARVLYNRGASVTAKTRVRSSGTTVTVSSQARVRKIGATQTVTARASISSYGALIFVKKTTFTKVRKYTAATGNYVNRPVQYN